jgi:16S rRNA (guanine527-N7)-methyltransferase
VPVPAQARTVAGDRVGLLTDYAALLADAGVTRGLIGPREVPRLWERHLLNCAVVTDSVPLDSSVADVGSGAGLPGLVWAICRPDLTVTLIEPLLRRVTFLNEAVDALGLTNVEVLRARAEDVHRQREFDVVGSRAVAPLDRLGAWCLPLVRRNGLMVAMKGSSAAEEIQSAGASIARLGGGTPDLVEHGQGVVEPTTWAVLVEKQRSSAPVGSPRRRSTGRKGRGRWG